MFHTSYKRVQTSPESQQRALLQEEPTEEPQTVKEEAVVKQEPKQDPLTPENELVAVLSPFKFPLQVKDDPDQSGTSQSSTWPPPRLEVYQPATSGSTKKNQSSAQTNEHFASNDVFCCERATEGGETSEDRLEDREEARTIAWRVQTSPESRQQLLVKDEPPSPEEEHESSPLQTGLQVKDDPDQPGTSQPRTNILSQQTPPESQQRSAVKEEPKQEPLTPDDELESCPFEEDSDSDQPVSWSSPQPEDDQPSTSRGALNRQELRTTVWRVQTSSENQQRVLVKQELPSPGSEEDSCPIQVSLQVKDEPDSDPDSDLESDSGSDKTDMSQSSTSSTHQQEETQPSSTKTSVSCPHCGESAQTLKHFVYRDLVFCEEAAEEGETLEKWLKDRQVPKTTIWRIKKKQELMLSGIFPRRKDRVCRMCGERKTRANGHTILRAARETFCSKTDPLGRTMEQWLTEKRGGVTTEQLKEQDRAVRNARAKAKRLRLLGKLPPRNPPVAHEALEDVMVSSPAKRRRNASELLQEHSPSRNTKKKKEFPDFYVNT